MVFALTVIEFRTVWTGCWRLDLIITFLNIDISRISFSWLCMSNLFRCIDCSDNKHITRRCQVIVRPRSVGDVDHLYTSHLYCLCTSNYQKSQYLSLSQHYPPKAQRTIALTGRAYVFSTTLCILIVYQTTHLHYETLILPLMPTNSPGKCEVL